MLVVVSTAPLLQATKADLLGRQLGDDVVQIATRPGEPVIIQHDLDDVAKLPTFQASA